MIADLRGRVVVRLVGATLLAGALAALIGGVLVSEATDATLREEALGRHRTTAAALVGRFDGHIATEITTLRMLASTEPIATGDGDLPGELRVVLAESRSYDELVLLDEDGRVIAAAASRFLADVDEFAPRPEVVEQVADGPFVALREPAHTALDIAVPVTRPDGTAAGALLATGQLEVLHDYLPTVDPATTTMHSFVSEDGRVLAHPERDRVVAGAVIPLEELGPGAVSAGVVEREDGGWLVAAAPTSSVPGAVVVEQPERAALGPAATRARGLVIILVAVLAATVVAILLVGGYVLRPLRPLVAGLARIGRGERGVRVQVSGEDEIAALGRDFNRMSAALDRRNEQVEELEHLALLIGGRADREELIRDATAGARKLGHAVGAAFQLFGGDAVAVETSGTVPPEILGTALDGPVERSASHEGRWHVTVLPVAERVSEPEGSIIVVRDAPLGDPTAQVLRSFASFVGVALRNVRRLELERQLVEELQGTIERRRDLVSSVTHELRTPLVCIEGFAAALQDNWTSFEEGDRRDLVSRIGAHAAELDVLVSELLDFSATERGVLRAQLTRIPLGETVEEVIAGLRPLIGARSVRIDVPDADVIADGDLLGRTLSNLISNAVKYSDLGSPVVVSGSRRGDVVRIEVADEGIGMTEDELANAFEPFWRGGPPGTQRVRGTGIGLALVAEYVRLMGGTHGARSTPGEGSAFHFTLPLADAARAERLLSQQGRGGGSS